MDDNYEIIVWAKGHTTGHIFRWKSKALSEEIIACVSMGKGFKLVTDNKISMAFGPGMVSHVQVREIGATND